MGITTGMLTEGTEVRNSAVMQRSKTVADAGAGGQVGATVHVWGGRGGCRLRMGLRCMCVDESTQNLGRRLAAAVDLPPSRVTPPPVGQVLMDQATFFAVKERLEELGAVDSSGLNTKRLNKLRPPKWLCW